MKHIHSNFKRQQSGVLLLSAIFVLLVLSLLAAIGVTLTSSAEADFDQASYSEKAYWAAREGLEWGSYHAQAFQSCSNPDGTDPGGIGQQTQGLPDDLALGGYDYQFVVGCESYDMVEGSVQIRVMTLVSTGTVGNLLATNYATGSASINAVKASRTLEMTIVVQCTGTCPVSGS